MWWIVKDRKWTVQEERRDTSEGKPVMSAFLKLLQALDEPLSNHGACQRVALNSKVSFATLGVPSRPFFLPIVMISKIEHHHYYWQLELVHTFSSFWLHLYISHCFPVALPNSWLLMLLQLPQRNAVGTTMYILNLNVTCYCSTSNLHIEPLRSWWWSRRLE